jgi:transcriptional regulator with XRE-family HTH domain
MPLRTNGDELRRRRELLGITITEFADATGYTMNHVSQVELGNRNAGPQYLRKAADLLECEISEITKGELPRRRKLRAPSAQVKPERAVA